MPFSLNVAIEFLTVEQQKKMKIFGFKSTLKSNVSRVKILGLISNSLPASREVSTAVHTVSTPPSSALQDSKSSV